MKSERLHWPLKLLHIIKDTYAAEPLCALHHSHTITLYDDSMNIDRYISVDADGDSTGLKLQFLIHL